MNHCRDCIFFSTDDNFKDQSVRTKLGKCHSPRNVDHKAGAIFEAVAGEPPYPPSWRFEYATTHRSLGRLSAILMSACGRDGRWFLPKEPTHA